MDANRVLLTDGSYQQTLAACRTLARKGLQVTIVANSAFAQSFFSRSCSSRYRLRSCSSSPMRYISELRSILARRKHAALLPIGFHSCYYISKYRHILEAYTSIPIAEFEVMEIAANKEKTMKLARKIGLDIPRTYYPNNLNDITHISKELVFPVVIKGSTEGGQVHYPRTPRQLQDSFVKLQYLDPIIQEYIDGYGCGFFALYNHGKCISYFMHKRLREYPPTGGPSVAARSYFSRKLEQQGKKILDYLQWHGVAMVEFKRNKYDGKYKLMEINPKFWGSLELAISAGVDFPYLAYQLATGQEPTTAKAYNSIEFRWPFPGDFRNAISTHRMTGFITDFGKSQIRDDIHIRDLGPLSIQILRTAFARFVRR